MNRATRRAPKQRLPCRESRSAHRFTKPKREDASPMPTKRLADSLAAPGFLVIGRVGEGLARSSRDGSGGSLAPSFRSTVKCESSATAITTGSAPSPTAFPTVPLSTQRQRGSSSPTSRKPCRCPCLHQYPPPVAVIHECVACASLEWEFGAAANGPGSLLNFQGHPVERLTPARGVT